MHVEARCWDVKEETRGEETVALNPHLLVMVKEFIRERTNGVNLLLDQRWGEEGVSRGHHSPREAPCAPVTHPFNLWKAASKGTEALSPRADFPCTPWRVCKWPLPTEDIGSLMQA